MPTWWATCCETVDDLDLALSPRGASVPEARAAGRTAWRMARDPLPGNRSRTRQGIEKIVPDDEPFDPNEAEALRLDPVDSPEEADGKVTETMRPGYRLGDQLIRPARVAVGRKS